MDLRRGDQIPLPEGRTYLQGLRINAKEIEKHCCQSVANLRPELVLPGWKVFLEKQARSTSHRT
jgi:hypothetical protein